MVSLTASDPQRWNRYAYVKNNTLRFTDPTGLDIVTFDETGNEIGSLRVRESWWHNLWFGDTYKLLTASGVTYELSEPLTPLPNGQVYRILGAAATLQLLETFLAVNSPMQEGIGLSWEEIARRAVDPAQWNWKVPLNQQFGPHALFVLDRAAQRSDYLGNYAFGYLMNAWGSSTFAAQWGGAVFNMIDSFTSGAVPFKGSILTGYDDPRDFAAIKAGGALYAHRHRR